MLIIKPIRTEEDYDRMGDRVYELMHLEDDELTESLSDELEVLVTLMDSYQKAHCNFPDPDPVSVIEFYMDQSGITRSDLIPCIGSAKKVSQVLNGTRALSYKMIRSLNEQLNIPAEMLVDKTKNRLPEHNPKFNWDEFPVKEIAKNSFLRDRRDLKDHSEELMRELIADAGGSDAVPSVLFRKKDSARHNSQMDAYALQAWCFYVLAEARSLRIEKKYKQGIVDEEFLRTVAQLSTRPDGPLEAKRFLYKNGIALIYARHLPRAYLDGAAMITKEGVPAIGMTIRLDKIDNFWFCLLHELAHVGWHLKNGMDWFIDDFSVNDSDFSEGWQKEHEADALAKNALIPESLWTKFRERGTFTEETIADLAKEAKVHPAIVAGRYRWETDNFQKFNDLMGSGEVRKLFAPS